MKINKDLIHETSVSTGTGNFTTALVNGKQRLDAAFGTGGTNVFDYFISNRDVNEWERGTGHMSATGTLVRDTVLDGTSGASAVSFTAGTKDVVHDIPAAEQARSTHLRGLLAGLTMSNNVGTPNSKIDVSAGVCRDATNVFTMDMAATTLDCGTTGANGLDTGALAASTWYNCWIIGKTDGTVSTFASTSGGPTLPVGYSFKRRIGSFRTDVSSHILAFSQFGDEFLWLVPIVDRNGVAIPTVATLFTLTVPTGVKVLARFRGAMIAGAGTSNTLLVQSPDETSAVASATAGNGDVSATNTASSLNAQFNIMARTDTSAQLRWSASGASGTGYITTFGWFDRRGRED